MKKTVEIAGYTVLPLRLPPSKCKGIKPATHYLYLQPHEPRIPDADTPRSLFIVNVPIDTTELHLRHLFGTQLGAGRVEQVRFEAVSTKKGGMATAHSMTGSVSKSKKRKRVTADELQNQLDGIRLPSTWDRELQKSGAHAVVVFVDKPSMEASIKAAKKAAKKDTEIVWGEGIEDRLPELGLQRYLNHEEARYPSRAELLRTVNDFMTVFEAVADARKKEQARRAQEPDEDGFITVTSGPKLTSVAHEDEAKELVEKQRKKSQGLGDFYRFQSREKRKERQNELLKKFDEDKKKLEEMKKRKGRIRTILTINRRHAKKFSSAIDDHAQPASERGYESFKEVAKDIEGLVDILWVTGTPSLQIPYLISLAVYINTYLPEYPFSPKATFRLLQKLDSVFASLLTGEDADSGAPLPGFGTGRNVVSMTEKVRIKSIAETCRVAVVEAREQSDGPNDEDEDDLSDDDDDMDDVFGAEDYPAPGRWEMETARVYEKTIQLLGDELGKAGGFCDTDLVPENALSG
ncbi:ribosomal small subunit assembly protein [Aspergillus coremiiformis]|uniref:Ribosomal small subunit assembly protein n=1 Tax=Aspergillus coremiiformis TaxID=138285 RepID=A0A5N6YWM1_9EURO|nr:ribosomal small subunit assembly protein [Aspergillus coremiiformis]